MPDSTVHSYVNKCQYSVANPGGGRRIWPGGHWDEHPVIWTLGGRDDRVEDGGDVSDQYDGPVAEDTFTIPAPPDGIIAGNAWVLGTLTGRRGRRIWPCEGPAGGRGRAGGRLGGIPAILPVITKIVYLILLFLPLYVFIFCMGLDDKLHIPHLP